MPNGHQRGRQPEGEVALSNAEPQARWRARLLSPQPPAAVPQHRPARCSRSKRWNDPLAEPQAIQAECTAGFEALPDSLRDTATAGALQEITEGDLDAIAAVQPPLGYRRD